MTIKKVCLLGAPADQSIPLAELPKVKADIADGMHVPIGGPEALLGMVLMSQLDWAKSKDWSAGFPG